jgi:hypothetical protein
MDQIIARQMERVTIIHVLKFRYFKYQLICMWCIISTILRSETPLCPSRPVISLSSKLFILMTWILATETGWNSRGVLEADEIIGWEGRLELPIIALVFSGLCIVGIKASDFVILGQSSVCGFLKVVSYDLMTFEMLPPYWYVLCLIFRSFLTSSTVSCAPSCTFRQTWPAGGHLLFELVP